MNRGEYEKPSLTVDVVIFSHRKGDWQLLLIQRQNEPFAGKWALPGGFVDIEEGLDEAAFRELEEETGIKGVNLVQFHTFGRPDRDPRGRVISVAYLAFLPGEGYQATAGDDAAAAAWFPLRALPDLAFDHDEIIIVAIRRFGELLKHSPNRLPQLRIQCTREEIDHFFEMINDNQRDSQAQE